MTKPVFEVMGIPLVVNPTMPVPHLWNGTYWTCLTCRQTSPDPCDCPCHADDPIEFRDRETGELVAAWGPHGIFQVRPASNPNRG